MRPDARVETRTTVPSRRPEVVSAARSAAFRVLLEVGAGRAHSDELLHASGSGAALERLSEADRGLAMALVMGVLRWQIALDARIRLLFARPESVVVNEVMVALRLGAFQLLHMDRIPAHAALSESVALVRAAGQEYATGMVNAVLRKIAAGPKAAAPPKIFETIPAMAERLGHPVWLVERWAAAYGRAAALAICEAGQREPESTGVLAVMEGVPMMDEGSRLVAELAAAVVIESSRDVRVWDCCAAPGGKTAVLAARLPGAEVLATDVSRRRLRTMEERLGAMAVSAGLGGSVRCLAADATALPAEEGVFDLVLCDVPCSGTGTLGRNPEIRLRLDAAELPRQAARQREILRAALGRVAAGGRVVYSTCSLEPEECERVVDALIAETGSAWRRVDTQSLLDELRERGVLQGELKDAVRDRALRTLPGVHAVDGFYAAVLERE